MADDHGQTDDVHPYGAGSHAPLEDVREMPSCYPIKGNVRDDGSLLYHRPDSRNYGATVPEVWFDSPSAAEAAGFELSPTHPRNSSGATYEPGGSGHPCTVAQVMGNRNAVPGGAASGAGYLAGAPALDAERHPYGVGSHAPLEDVREMPSCYPIKGNVRDDGSLLYHRPDSRNYGATVPEVWFDSPSAAEAAGFELSPTHPRNADGADFELGGSGHPCTVDEVGRIRAEVGGGAGALGLASAGAGVVLGADAVDAELHPYGIGSRATLSDEREMPDCHPIKGNIRPDGSRLYHRPDSRNYGATVPEVWFDSPSAAEAAGFVLAPTHPRRANAADFEPGGSGHPCTVAQVDGFRSASAGLAAAGLTGVAALAGSAAGGGDGTDGNDEDDGDGEQAGGRAGLAVAGAAGAAAAAGATLSRLVGGRGDDDDDADGADATAGAASSADDVAGPSGDPLAGSAARASEQAREVGETTGASSAGPVGDAGSGDTGTDAAGGGRGADDEDGVGRGSAAAGAVAVGAAGAAASRLVGSDADAAVGAGGDADADADVAVDGDGDGEADGDGGLGLGGVAAGAAAAGVAGVAAAAAEGGGRAGDAVDAAGEVAGGAGDVAGDVAGGAAMLLVMSPVVLPMLLVAWLVGLPMLLVAWPVGLPMLLVAWPVRCWRCCWWRGRWCCRGGRRCRWGCRSAGRNDRRRRRGRRFGCRR